MRVNQTDIVSSDPRAHGEVKGDFDLPAHVFVSVDCDEDAPAAIAAIRACLPPCVEVHPMASYAFGETPVDTDPTGVWRAQIECLSKREREVLQELVDGYTFVDAAARLFVSRHTFRTHMKNILAKLDVHSSLEAVSVGVRAGMRPRVEEIVLD